MKQNRTLTVYQPVAAAVAAFAALWFGGLLPFAAPDIPGGGLILCGLAAVLAAVWLVLAVRGGAFRFSGALAAAAAKALLPAGLLGVVVNVRLPVVAHPVQFAGCVALFWVAAFLLCGAHGVAAKRVAAVLLSLAVGLVLLRYLAVQTEHEPGAGNVSMTLSATYNAEAPPAGPLQVTEVQAYEAAVDADGVRLSGFNAEEGGGYGAYKSGVALRYTAGAQWYTHVVFAEAPAGWQVELSSGNLAVQHNFTGEEAMPFTLSFYTEPAVNWPLTLLLVVPLGALAGLGLVYWGEIRAWGLRAKQKAPRKTGRTGKPQKPVAALLLAALPPVVFLYFAYNQNFDYLSFGQVAVVALAFATLGALLQLGLARLLKNANAAGLVMLVVWVLFFTFNQIFVGLEGVCLGLKLPVFTAVALAALVLLCPLLCALGRRIRGPEAPRALAVVLCVVLMMNLGPVVWYQVSAPKYDPDQYKTTFTVDESTPSPNIYWFHIDGMQSMAGVAELFGDEQAEFRAALAERGFVVNDDAWFESGHTTTVAMLELMSPSFYEAEILPMLDFDSFNDDAAYMAMVNALRDPSLKNQLDMAHVNNETLVAFAEKGYHTSAITYSDLTIYKTVDVFYSMADADLATPVLTPKDDAPGSAFLAGQDRANLANVLTSATALRLLRPQVEALVQRMNAGTYEYGELTWPKEAAREIIGQGYEEAGEVTVRALGEILESEEPRFAVVHDVQAHTPYVYDEKGERILGQSGADFDHYYPQHVYARGVLVKLLDMVLAADPEAVIVLQSDHGLHGTTREEMAAAGVADLAEVQLTWNGNISAVRIPESYGGQDSPMDPLNIARELVNRFVGDNYDLLPNGQPNQRKGA